MLRTAYLSYIQTFSFLIGPQDEEGAFIDPAVGELVLKLTTMTRRNVFQLENCIN